MSAILYYSIHVHTAWLITVETQIMWVAWHWTMYYYPTIFVKSYGALTYFDDLMVITGYRNRNGKQRKYLHLCCTVHYRTSSVSPELSPHFACKDLLFLWIFKKVIDKYFLMKRWDENYPLNFTSAEEAF